MEIFNVRLARNPKCFRSAGYLCLHINFAAPSSVISAQELADLSHLPVPPLHADLDWSHAQTRSSLPCGIYLQQASIREVKVGAHRLGLDACSPGVFRILPECQVGIHKSVGFLGLSNLEIDASMGGLE